MWKISDVLLCLIIFIYRVCIIESVTYNVTRSIRATNVGSDKDICTLCNCQNENNLSTINCDLTDNKVSRPLKLLISLLAFWQKLYFLFCIIKVYILKSSLSLSSPTYNETFCVPISFLLTL